MLRPVAVVSAAFALVFAASTATAQFLAGSGNVTGSVTGMGADSQDADPLMQFLGANNASWNVSQTTGSGTTSGGLCDGDNDATCDETGETLVATVNATFNASATSLRAGLTIYRIHREGRTTFDTNGGRYTGDISFSLVLTQLIITIPGPDPQPISLTDGQITNVDTNVSYGAGLVPPGNYFLPTFSLNGTATAAAGGSMTSSDWELRVGTEPECCQPWDNGRFDLTSAQLGQISADQTDWRLLRQYAADDMFLCEGQVHRIDSIAGRITTNSLVPKALVIVYADCNGLPSDIIAVAGLEGTRFQDQFDEDVIPGTIVLNETNEFFEGLRILQVTAEFDKLWLKGGAYWVSIVGFSAALNPLDEFYWGFSGNGVVKGRPGVFITEEGVWTSSDELCCGCTDYNFCAIGESCKILLDNGPPRLTGGIEVPFPGLPSLQNGNNTQTRSRAADKFVLLPCTRFEPCYIEGWIWTNCDRVALQFFRDACHCPLDLDAGSPLRYADCVIETGLFVNDSTNVPVELKKAQFFFTNPTEIDALLGRVPNSQNLWLSLVGLGENRQNARAYFALADPCNRDCTTFGPACYRSAPFTSSRWQPNGLEGTSLPGFDHAFLVAVRQPERVPQAPATSCPADIDRNGALSVQDLFDFLAAWFAGCP